MGQVVSIVLTRLAEDPESALEINGKAMEWAREIHRHAGEQTAISREALDSATRSEEDLLPEARRVQLLHLLDDLLAEGPDPDVAWWDRFEEFLRENRFRI